MTGIPPTTWAPAGAKPRLPFPRLSAKRRREDGFGFSMAWLSRDDQY
jgi:hypothetical protein